MIGAMATVTLAGMDPWPLLRSGDPVFVAVGQAIAVRALQMRRRDHEARDHNLAVAIANNIAKILR